MDKTQPSPSKKWSENNVLLEASKIINPDSDREQTYGEPSKNLECIAGMWESYLMSRGLLDPCGSGILASDVALMMVLLKVARLANSPDHVDSQVDICGYTALLERIQKEGKR